MAEASARPAVILNFEPSEENDYPESGTNAFRTLRQPKSVTFTNCSGQVKLIRYKYKPLASPRDIRLCRLNKEKYHVYGEDNLNLRIPILEIVHYSLDECPKYIALSYAWGDMVNERPFIGVGDQSFICITSALFDALQPLSRGTGSLVLIWIDQICINQYDLAERASQVSMMRDIFQRGHLNYTWLGSGDESTGKAYELIRRIGELNLGLKEVLSARYRDHLVHLVGANGSTLGNLLANETEANWEALSNLIRRPWFSRLWTFQEVVVSGLYQAIVCGNQLVGWLELGIAAWIGDIWMPEIVDAIQIYNTMITQTTYLAGKTRLLEMLQMTGRGYECSDPRDKLFALLGLIPAGGPNIDINYGESVQSVFSASAIALMEHSKSLNHLSAVNERTDPFSIGLPSWCPDWRDPPHAQTLRKSKYHASRDRMKFIQPERTSSQLQVYGKLLDVVNDVEESQALFDLIKNVSSQDALCNLKNTLNRLEQEFITSPQFSSISGPRDLRDVIIRTITVDGTEDNPTPAADVQAMVSSVFGDAEGPSYIEESMKNIASGFPRLKIESVYCGSRQILTLEKHTIGLGPFAASKGDLVSILHGSSTPVVLRADGDSYRVIGQCFVDGMMYGEALSWEESEGDLITLI